MHQNKDSIDDDAVVIISSDEISDLNENALNKCKKKRMQSGKLIVKNSFLESLGIYLFVFSRSFASCRFV